MDLFSFGGAMHRFQRYKHSEMAESARFVRQLYILLVTIAGIILAKPTSLLGQELQLAELHASTIVGTVTNVNHDTVPGAPVVLDGPGI